MTRTPADLQSWTEGRAIIATGKPFPPIKRNGKEYRVDQILTNAYVYPGIGLGAIVCAARHISDGMFRCGARTGRAIPCKARPALQLLPTLVEIRKISFQVALAVTEQAQAEGLAEKMSEDIIASAIKEKMWDPAYAKYGRRFR